MNYIKTVLIPGLVLIISANAADESSIYELYRQKMKPAYRHADNKCGTYHLLEMAPYLNNLEKDALFRVPDRQKSLVTPGGNFTLHWDETGNHAVPAEDISGNGVPDYIDSAAVIFDNVWQIEVEEMGFQPPLGADGQPVTNYDIYFSNIAYYGLTNFSLLAPDEIPSVPGTQYLSYIEVDNDFSGGAFYTHGLDALRVTAAHEFNHAIQLTINVWMDNGSLVDRFFMEMTSTWLEDVLYPEVNDYFTYLDLYFSQVSGASFSQFSGLYAYGNSLFLHMLGKKLGEVVVADIWDAIKNQPSLQAMPAVLSVAPYNTSFATMLSDYTLWLYYTGSRARPADYFTDSAFFPEIEVKFSDFVSTLDTQPISRVINNRAIRFLNVGDAGDLRFNLLVENADNQNGSFYIFSNDLASQRFEVGDVADLLSFSADTITAAVVNTASAEKNFDLTFRASSGLVLADVFPNPVLRQEGHSKLTFRNLDDNTEVIILNTSGKQVVKLFKSSKGSLDWNLRNNRGEEISAGIYLYLIKSKSMQKSGKFSVIR